MMADTVVRARIDGETKKKAMAALNQMGLSASDAIRLLFMRIAEEEAMPFAIKKPNATTRAAMAELADGGGKSYQSVKALTDDLNT